jgi:hypothetical protein
MAQPLQAAPFLSCTWTKDVYLVGVTKMKKAQRCDDCLKDLDSPTAGIVIIKKGNWQATVCRGCADKLTQYGWQIVIQAK